MGSGAPGPPQIRLSHAAVLRPCFVTFVRVEILSRSETRTIDLACRCVNLAAWDWYPYFAAVLTVTLKLHIRLDPCV